MKNVNVKNNTNFALRFLWSLFLELSLEKDKSQKMSLANSSKK